MRGYKHRKMPKAWWLTDRLSAGHTFDMSGLKDGLTNLRSSKYLKFSLLYYLSFLNRQPIDTKHYYVRELSRPVFWSVNLIANYVLGSTFGLVIFSFSWKNY